MIKSVSINCEACGKECFENELETVKLSGYNSEINICLSCSGKNPENQYKDAIDLLSKISSSLHDKDRNPAERIDQIKKMLDGDI